MEDFLNFIKDLPPYAIFISLFIASFVENVFPPVPGDTVTIFGGALVGLGAASFTNVFIATCVGSAFGFMTLYAAGFKLGRQFFSRPNAKVFHPENLAKIDGWFSRHENWVLVLNRFMAGTRSLVSIVAGISKRNWIKVSILSSLSIMIWNGILITAGYYLGQNWEIAEQAVRTYSEIITILLIVLLIIFIIYKYRRKQKS